MFTMCSVMFSIVLGYHTICVAPCPITNTITINVIQFVPERTLNGLQNQGQKTA